MSDHRAGRVRLDIPVGEKRSYEVQWPVDYTGYVLRWNAVVLDEMTADLAVSAQWVGEDTEQVTEVKGSTRARHFTGSISGKELSEMLAPSAGEKTDDSGLMLHQVMFSFSNEFSWFNPKIVEFVTLLEPDSFQGDGVSKGGSPQEYIVDLGETEDLRNPKLRRGHVFVVLSDVAELSGDARCVPAGGWSTSDGAASPGVRGDGDDGSGAVGKQRPHPSCSSSGPAGPDPGYSRVAIQGSAGAPVVVSTLTAVPPDVHGVSRELDWLMLSYEEFLVASARWLCRPKEQLAAALWDEAQQDAQLVWRGLYPRGAGNLSQDNLLERLRQVLGASTEEEASEEDARRMLESLCPSGAEGAEAELTAGRFAGALFRGEAPTAGRQCHLLMMPLAAGGDARYPLAEHPEVHDVAANEEMVLRLLRLLDQAASGSLKGWPKDLQGRPVAMDIALVCEDKPSFCLAQSLRLRQEMLFFPDGCLEAGLRRCAVSLGREASSGSLAVYVGPSANFGAGLAGVLKSVEEDIKRLTVGSEAGGEADCSEAEDEPATAARLASLIEQLPDQAIRELLKEPPGSADDGAKSQNGAPTDAVHILKHLVAFRLRFPAFSLVDGLVAGMPVSRLITPSPDDLLERASDRADWRNPKRPFRKAALGVLPHKPAKGAARWLLKLHGCMHDPTSIALMAEELREPRAALSILGGLAHAELHACHLLCVGVPAGEASATHRQVLQEVIGARHDQPPVATVLLRRSATPADENTAVSVHVLGEECSEAARSRAEEIFLDLCAAYAALRRMEIMDSRVAALHSKEELWLLRCVERLHDAVASPPDELDATAMENLPAYKEVMRCLSALGVEERKVVPRGPHRVALASDAKSSMTLLDDGGITAEMDSEIQSTDAGHTEQPIEDLYQLPWDTLHAMHENASNTTSASAALGVPASATANADAPSAAPRTPTAAAPTAAATPTATPAAAAEAKTAAPTPPTLPAAATGADKTAAVATPPTTPTATQAPPPVAPPSPSSPTVASPVQRPPLRPLVGRASQYDVDFPAGTADKLGLELAIVNGELLRVDGVSPGGPAHEWNTSSSPALAIRTGDIIVEANGVTGNPDELMARFSPDMPLRLRLFRPELRLLRVEKRGQKAGLRLNYSRHEWCAFLEVEAVGEGAVADAIRESGARPLGVGDRIIEVNGVGGRPDQLLGALGAQDTVELVIVPHPAL